MLMLLWLTLLLLGETTSSKSSPQFKIGYLSPWYGQVEAGIHYTPPSSAYSLSNNKNNKLACTERLSALESAITFAREKLSHLFLDYYGCNLVIDQASTNCDVSYGTRSFFELAKDIQRTLLVFGGSCDTTIKPIAESVQYFNLTMLSYSEADPTFSDQSKYNGFYKLVPGEEHHNQLRLHLIKKYNWTRIGTIYLTKAKYTLAHNMLIQELDKWANLTMSRSILENQGSNQYEQILKEFKNNDIKIIIGIFDQTTALKLFCEIYKQNMYGDKYQWITLGSYNIKTLFVGHSHESNCTIDQILIAMNGTLQTRVVQNSYEFDRWLYDDHDELDKKEPKKLDINRHYESIVNSYMKQVQESARSNLALYDNDCQDQYFHGYAFDLLLAIFKVLSTLIESDQFSCENLNFRRDVEWFYLLNGAFSKISFKGVTGNVTFRDGSRLGQIKMEQLLVDKDSFHPIESLIFVHDQNEDSYINFNTIKWHGKNPPRDHTIKIKILFKISKTIFSGMCALASLGILIGILFLVFNIKFRKHRFIKMSSPYLNNLIIIGCLFSYLSIYFMGEIDGLVPNVCVVRVWLLTVGFTLAFGAMFSKTYRVHAILTNAKLTKKVIKDYKLYGMVIIFLVIDFIILVNWQIFDPMKLVPKPYESKSDEEKIIVVESLVCESRHMKIWVGSLFTYKSLLILFGCFFAYETRHVKIAALNDSKYIGISVYNVLIMCSTGAAIAFIVDSKNAAFVLITLFIFACTTITLCLVFLPKILEVKKDPVGKKKKEAKNKNAFKKVQGKHSSRMVKYNDKEDFDKKIAHLMEDNKQKRNLIEQANKKLEMLVQKALSIGSNCFEECLRLLSTDDIEIQKLINQISSNFSEASSSNSMKRNITQNSIRADSDVNNQLNEQPLFSDKKTCETVSTALLSEPSFTVTQDAPVDEVEHQVKITIQKADSLVEEENLVELPKLKIQEENEIESIAAISFSPPTTPRSQKRRKFNPPPRIIDLNEADVNSNFGDCYSFKVDI